MAIFLIKDGENTNRATKEIVITDGSVFPDNGTNYGSETKYIPTGSQLQVLTDTAMTVFVFNAESGIINISTGYQEGVWISV